MDEEPHFIKISGTGVEPLIKTLLRYCATALNLPILSLSDLQPPKIINETNEKKRKRPEIFPQSIGSRIAEEEDPATPKKRRKRSASTSLTEHSPDKSSPFFSSNLTHQNTRKSQKDLLLRHLNDLKDGISALGTFDNSRERTEFFLKMLTYSAILASRDHFDPKSSKSTYLLYFLDCERKKPTGRRYRKAQPGILEIATSVYQSLGSSKYEWLRKDLMHLPSSTTVCRRINNGLVFPGDDEHIIFEQIAQRLKDAQLHQGALVWDEVHVDAALKVLPGTGKTVGRVNYGSFKGLNVPATDIYTDLSQQSSTVVGEADDFEAPEDDHEVDPALLDRNNFSPEVNSQIDRQILPLDSISYAFEPSNAQLIEPFSASQPTNDSQSTASRNNGTQTSSINGTPICNSSKLIQRGLTEVERQTTNRPSPLLATQVLQMMVVSQDHDKSLALPGPFYAVEGVSRSRMALVIESNVSKLEAACAAIGHPFEVTSLISDGSSFTRSFVKEAHHSSSSELFPKSTVRLGSRTFAMLRDLGHIIKRARNYLYNSRNNKKTAKLMYDGNFLTWDIMETAFNDGQTTSDLPLQYKMVFLNENSKMNVSLATGLFATKVMTWLKSRTGWNDTYTEYFECWSNVMQTLEQKRSLNMSSKADILAPLQKAVAYLARWTQLAKLKPQSYTAPPVQMLQDLEITLAGLQHLAQLNINVSASALHSDYVENWFSKMRHASGHNKRLTVYSYIKRFIGLASWAGKKKMSSSGINTSVSVAHSLDLTQIKRPATDLESQIGRMNQAAATLIDQGAPVKPQKLERVPLEPYPFTVKPLRHYTAQTKFIERSLPLLKSHFNLSSFRPGQLESIGLLSKGKDVFSILSTGAGKSLIILFDAILHNGLTVVISPLISLIEDQFASTIKILPACFKLMGTDDPITQNLVLANIRDKSDYDVSPAILFVTPEKLYNSIALHKVLLHLNEKGHLRKFVLDEIHFVASWGITKFRPEYALLQEIFAKFKGVRLLGLTATATPPTQILINQTLKWDPCIISMPIFRPNLRITIEYSKDRMHIRDLIKEHHLKHTGIIYCPTHDSVDVLTYYLNNSGLKAVSYYGTISSSKRQAAHNAWKSGDALIMVATSAYGTGIDHSDVGFVIHYGLPYSLESYFQEIGRAGRSGGLAHCYLFFHPSEFPDRYSKYNNNLILEKDAFEYLISGLTQLKAFAYTDRCAWLTLGRLVQGSTFSVLNCKNCHNCFKNIKTPIECTEYSKSIVGLIELLSDLKGEPELIVQNGKSVPSAKAPTIFKILTGKVSLTALGLPPEFKAFHGIHRTMDSTLFYRLIHKLEVLLVIQSGSTIGRRDPKVAGCWETFILTNTTLPPRVLVSSKTTTSKLFGETQVSHQESTHHTPELFSFEPDSDERQKIRSLLGVQLRDWRNNEVKRAKDLGKRFETYSSLLSINDVMTEKISYMMPRTSDDFLEDPLCKIATKRHKGIIKLIETFEIQHGHLPRVHLLNDMEIQSLKEQMDLDAQSLANLATSEPSAPIPEDVYSFSTDSDSDSESSSDTESPRDFEQQFIGLEPKYFHFAPPDQLEHDISSTINEPNHIIQSLTMSPYTLSTIMSYAQYICNTILMKKFKVDKIQQVSLARSLKQPQSNNPYRGLKPQLVNWIFFMYETFQALYSSSLVTEDMLPQIQAQLVYNHRIYEVWKAMLDKRCKKAANKTTIEKIRQYIIIRIAELFVYHSFKSRKNSWGAEHEFVPNKLHLTTSFILPPIK